MIRNLHPETTQSDIRRLLEPLDVVNVNIKAEKERAFVRISGSDESVRRAVERSGALIRGRYVVVGRLPKKGSGRRGEFCKRDLLFPDLEHAQRHKLLLDEVAEFSATATPLSEKIVEMIRILLPTAEAITDGTACTGADSASFAKAFSSVTAVEFDEKRYENMLLNLAVFTSAAIRKKIRTERADYTKICETLKQDVLYLDPPWGGRDYRDKGIYTISLSDETMRDLCLRVMKACESLHLVVLKVPNNYDFDLFADTMLKGTEEVSDLQVLYCRFPSMSFICTRRGETKQWLEKTAKSLPFERREGCRIFIRTKEKQWKEIALPEPFNGLSRSVTMRGKVQIKWPHRYAEVDGTMDRRGRYLIDVDGIYYHLQAPSQFQILEGKPVYYQGQDRKWSFDVTNSGHILLETLISRTSPLIERCHEVMENKMGWEEANRLSKEGSMIYARKPNKSQNTPTWSQTEYGHLGFQKEYLQLKSMQRFTETWTLLERAHNAGAFKTFSTKKQRENSQGSERKTKKSIDGKDEEHKVENQKDSTSGPKEESGNSKDLNEVSVDSKTMIEKPVDTKEENGDLGDTKENESKCKEDDGTATEVTIASLGGGPGFELMAFELFFQRHYPKIKLRLFSLDLESSWGQYVELLGYQFIQWDFSKGEFIPQIIEKSKGKGKKDVEKVDFVVLSYVFYHYMRKAECYDMLSRFLQRDAGKGVLISSRFERLEKPIEELEKRKLKVTKLISQDLGRDDRQLLLLPSSASILKDLDSIERISTEFPNVPYEEHKPKRLRRQDQRHREKRRRSPERSRDNRKRRREDSRDSDVKGRREGSYSAETRRRTEDSRSTETRRRKEDNSNADTRRRLDERGANRKEENIFDLYKKLFADSAASAKAGLDTFDDIQSQSHAAKPLGFVIDLNKVLLRKELVIPDETKRRKGCEYRIGKLKRMLEEWITDLKGRSTGYSSEETDTALSVLKEIIQNVKTFEKQNIRRQSR